MIKLLEQAYSRTRQQKIHEIASSLLLQDNGKDNILTTYLNLLPFPYGRQ
ncbi:transglycosylase domain-containing protein [Patescibacteria group bacterium]|nr:transglycosylase domain-containing protein [Patescibacteria group bacterium]